MNTEKLSVYKKQVTNFVEIGSELDCIRLAEAEQELCKSNWQANIPSAYTANQILYLRDRNS